MSLATKYRPVNLDDVIGQEFITTVLKKEYETDSLSQAYLFMGIPGSGKTTTARILANMLNGYVIEIDIASNNSAESMRELISSVSVKPIGRDKTIVILDEVHAASSACFQTLLKVLEEPPRHVIFILCTTEGDKIISTIKSRCESFYFNPINTDTISSRLVDICKKENIKAEETALKMIAYYADGSMRQAITYVESLSSNDITAASVRNNLIKSKYDDMFSILYAVSDKNNIPQVITTVRNIGNIDKFVTGFFTFVLGICIYHRVKDLELSGIPLVFKDELESFTDKDFAVADKLKDDLYDLQYTGKNSPILKELLLAVLLKEMY